MTASERCFDLFKFTETFY